MTGRFCIYCIRPLQSKFQLVLNADGELVPVHNHCAEPARRFWTGRPVLVPMMDGRTSPANIDRDEHAV